MRTEALDRIDLETLKRLRNEANSPALSFFLPMREKGSETLKNPVRLKHLLSEAEKRLVADGIKSAEIEHLLEPLRKLLDDFEFWQHQSHGLAIFRDDDHLETLKLAHRVEELLHVGSRFYLKPLLPELDSGDRFYVLKLSQNEVALYSGDAYSLEPVSVPDLPSDIDEALWYDDPERSLQQHTNVAPTKSRQADAGGPSAQFHGQGVHKDQKKNDLKRFFREIDDALTNSLEGESAPLLLAAVEYYHPIYREVNSYTNLAEELIPGNPENLSREKLQQAAYAKVIEPRQDKHRKELIERIREAVAKGVGSQKIEEVATAAREGRVAACIVEENAQIHGRYNEERFTYERVSGEPSAPELTEVAAIETLLHGGEVVALSGEENPFETPVAAVYRY